MKKHRRTEIHAKLDGHCAYCGDPITIQKMQVDHMVPRSDFEGHRSRGRFPAHLSHITHPDHRDNLYPSCGVCNKWKSSHDLEFFRSEIAEQVNRLKAYSAPFRFAMRYGLLRVTPKPIIFHFEKHPLFKKHYLIISEGLMIGCTTDQASVLSEEPDAEFQEIKINDCPVCNDKEF